MVIALSRASFRVSIGMFSDSTQKTARASRGQLDAFVLEWLYE